MGIQRIVSPDYLGGGPVMRTQRTRSGRLTGLQALRADLETVGSWLLQLLWHSGNLGLLLFFHFVSQIRSQSFVLEFLNILLWHNLHVCSRAVALNLDSSVTL